MILSWPLYDLESGNSWFVKDMTILSHDFERTSLDKYNEPRIIQIEQIEAEIFAISISESKPVDLYR